MREELPGEMIMLNPSFLIARGLIGVAIGLAAFAWPGLTIAVLMAIFAAYALIDGAANVVLGLSGNSLDGVSWPLVFEGIAGVAVGVMAVFWPVITALALIWFIGARAVVTGTFEIMAAFRLRRVITGEWLLLLSGVVSVLFGLMLFVVPVAGAIWSSWVSGTYAFVTGVILMTLGIKMRTHRSAFA